MTNPTSQATILPVIGSISSPRIDSVKTGEFELSAYGELDSEVWYRFLLTVTDSDQLTCETYMDVLPKLDTMYLYVDPPDLTMNLDGKSVESGDTIIGVVGMIRSAEATTPQNYFGTRMIFDQWHDGEKSRIRNFAFGEFNELSSYYENGDYLIYPNPTYGYLNVGIKKVDLPFDYQIIDSQGKLALEGSYMGGDEVVLRLSTLDIPPGLYFFRIIEGDNIWVSKFCRMYIE